MGPTSQHVSPLLCKQVSLMFCKQSSNRGPVIAEIPVSSDKDVVRWPMRFNKAPCGIAATLVFHAGRVSRIGEWCRLGLLDDAGWLVRSNRIRCQTVQVGSRRCVESLGNRDAKHQTMFKTNNNTPGLWRWWVCCFFFGGLKWGMGGRSTDGKTFIRAWEMQTSRPSRWVRTS
jgi:hypothetical protein